MEMIFENKSNTDKTLSVRRYEDTVDFVVDTHFASGIGISSCTLDKGQVLELVRGLQGWLNYE